MDYLESNVSTEHAEDVERDHLRDPEVEWLEPLVGETGEVPPVDAPVATPAQRMSHFLAGFTLGPRPATSRDM